jgi:hypothetical protein
MRVIGHQISSRFIGIVVAGALGAGTFVAARGASRGEQSASAQPQIVVGGIRVAKVTAPKDDMFAKAFNADNGTTLLLWVKMPAGQGLIEIDEDTSLLQHFGDDKGTDLGGKFESFPDEFKDGSGGTIEIESTGMPAATATKLTAEGTIALTIATGVKPQRVANVRVENGRTFMLGQTSVTVAEVEPSGEDLRFTLKLPRSVMEGIKDVRFLDAKNQPLEGRRTGTGYFNDAGEMSVTVKTALRTVTLEFDIWQGRRAIKVPFKVQAGVGLGG